MGDHRRRFQCFDCERDEDAYDKYVKEPCQFCRIPQGGTKAYLFDGKGICCCCWGHLRAADRRDKECPTPTGDFVVAENLSDPRTCVCCHHAFARDKDKEDKEKPFAWLFIKPLPH